LGRLEGFGRGKIRISLGSPYSFRQFATTMTYRFDKSGKRIPAGTAKDKIVASAESQNIQSTGLQKSVAEQRTTGTSHLVQTQKGSLASQKIGRKAPDADLRKPLRHIGIAFAAVLSIVIMMLVINMAASTLEGLRAKRHSAPPPVASTNAGRAIAAVPLANLGHWSKAEVLKNLFATSQKAHGSRNYSAENAILKNLSQPKQKHC
jgi:hypothetical protein